MEPCAGMMRQQETNTAPAKPLRSGAPCAGCSGNRMKMQSDQEIPEPLNIMMQLISRMTKRGLGGCTAKEAAQFWPWPATCNSSVVKLSKRIPKRRQAEDRGR